MLPRMIVVNGHRTGVSRLLATRQVRLRAKGQPDVVIETSDWTPPAGTADQWREALDRAVTSAREMWPVNLPARKRGCRTCGRGR